MNSGRSRIKNTLMSTVTGMVAYLIVVLLGFVGRSIFIQYLSVDLLGVNGLFSSILQIFSLAELGFATAVGVALYKPLSKGDEKSIAVLMRFYAKVYTCIGFIVLALGAIALPFLQYLIKDFDKVKDIIPLDQLRIYFVLFLLSSSASYFFAYKKTLLISDQKKYIVNINMSLISIISRIAQILVVIYLKNFTVYLIVNLASVYLENIIASIIVDKQYPYLKKYKSDRLEPSVKKKLYGDISALSISKLGSVFTSGIVSIIISIAIGIKESGLYSNYLLVTTSIMAVTNVIFEAVTASVGNFVATEEGDKHKVLFKRIYYFSAIWSTLILVGLVVLFDDFIRVWLNEDMVLGKGVSIIMAVHLYIWSMRQISWVLYNAYGLYKHFFYRVFGEIVIFCVLGFLGAYTFGIAGILGAQIIAVLLTQFWVEIYVVSKYALNSKTLYLSQLAKYLALSLLSLGITYTICYFIPLGGMIGFIVKLFVIVALVLCIFASFTFKSDEMKYYVGLVKRLFAKRSKNG